MEMLTMQKQTKGRVKRGMAMRCLKSCTFFWVVFIICANSFAQAPAIVSFTPANGPVGTAVTITGVNLNSLLSFTIGGVPAIEISNNGSTLVGMVMPGATNGNVSISTAGGSTTSGSSYTVTSTYFPASQQGNKLVGTGAVGASMQGYSVAISGDGNTVIVGAPNDNSNEGAAFVFVRSGGGWTQEAKLVGTGAIGVAQQGISVALNGDGNTAVVGGYVDNSDQGAVWVFTRSGGTWTQQAKLVGTSPASPARQGSAVSASADGNTILVGGNNDNFNQGAAWVFVRSSGTWSQQGGKLVGTGNVGSASQGSAVALSADGNTAVLGGTDDNTFTGASWIFVRSGGVWSQQGSKLVGSGSIGSAYQGSGVSLSADGNTMITGGYNDNSGIGASWVFTRSGGTWTQQAKLTGTGNTGLSGQGYAVSLSADGNTAFIGGNWNNANRGSQWVFTRSAGTWTQQGNPITGTGGTGSSQQGYFVGLSADGGTAVSGGFADNANTGAAWIFIPSVVPTIISFSPSSGVTGSSVTITGTNFNTTPSNNIVYFGATQATVTASSSTSLSVVVPLGATFDKITVMNGGLMAYSAQWFLPVYTPSKSSISASDVQVRTDFSSASNIHSLAIGDLDNDGKADIAAVNFSAANLVSVFRNTSVSGSITASSFASNIDFTTANAPYGIAIGDIDGDGKLDLVVTSSVTSVISILRNTSSPGSVSFAAKVDFTVGLSPMGVAIGDIDRDGKADIAVANSITNDLSVLRNTSSPGSLLMDTKVDFSCANTPYAVAIGDIDGDEKPEVIIANKGSNSISVFRNLSSAGAISLAGKVDFTTGNAPLTVAAGDIDGDTKADILTANFGSNNASVFRNTSSIGSISFASRSDFTLATQPGSAVLTDYDGDGLADIIASNTNSNAVSLLRNTSTIGSVSMASKVDVTSGLYPATVVAGDFDGDGLPDLATANYSSNTLSIFRNNSANYTFYSSSAGAANLQNLTSWGTATDGSGANPVSFSNSSYIFQLANGPGNVYTINGDLSIAGKLVVPGGAAFSTGGFNLSIGDDMTNDGTISGAVTLNGTALQTISGTGIFADLTINNSSGVMLAGNTTISNSLTFTQGKLTIGGFYLIMSGSTSSINGASSSKYIVTNGNAALVIQNIGPGGRTGNITFPVGNSTYNPAVINNAGTPDDFQVLVLDDVYDAYSGSTPTGSIHNSNVVDRTWIVDEGTAGGSDVTLTLQWSAADELAGFTRTDCNVSHYKPTGWSPDPVSSAAGGSNPYTQSRSGIQSFSPFGVHNNGGPLPVQWLSFTGKKVFDNVQLNWTTASEINNSHFEIERSADGKKFEFAGRVEGNGTTTHINSYKFVDAGAFAKANSDVLYYRLKQVDFNGDFEYSSIIAVSKGKTGDGVTIETINPNPFTQQLHVTLNNVSEGNVTIAVYDMSGKVLYTHTQITGSGKLVIDLNELSNLPEGVYVLSVTNGSETIRQKLVKVQ